MHIQDALHIADKIERGEEVRADSMAEAIRTLAQPHREKAEADDRAAFFATAGKSALYRALPLNQPTNDLPNLKYAAGQVFYRD